MQWYQGPEGDQRIWYEADDLERIAEDELRRADLMPTLANPVTNLERFIGVVPGQEYGERRKIEMSKYRVILKANAYFTIEVEANNPELALEEAYDKAPTLCAHCVGWGKNWGLELSGEWNVEEDVPSIDYYGVEKIED